MVSVQDICDEWDRTARGIRMARRYSKELKTHEHMHMKNISSLLALEVVTRVQSLIINSQREHNTS